MFSSLKEISDFYGFSFEPQCDSFEGIILDIFNKKSIPYETMNPALMNVVGDWHFYAMGNARSATSWYSDAADHGNSYGMMNLALSIHTESCDSQNVDCVRHVRLLEQSASFGNTRAMIALGDFYSNPLSFDSEKAEQWYVEAGKRGDKTAFEKQGTFYKNNGNIEKMVIALQSAIDLGSVLASFQLGKYHHLETKNYAEMEKYYSLGIAEKYSASLNNMGFYHFSVTRDYPEALRLYKEAAALGEAVAMHNLGVYYASVEKDTEKSLYWYKIASKEGCFESMYIVAKHYFEIQEFEKSWDLLNYLKRRQFGRANPYIFNYYTKLRILRKKPKRMEILGPVKKTRKNSKNNAKKTISKKTASENTVSETSEAVVSQEIQEATEDDQETESDSTVQEPVEPASCILS